MKRAIASLGVVGFLMGSVAAGAETDLMFVTPQNIKDGTFRLSSKTGRNNTVEFVIRRDVSNLKKTPSQEGRLSEDEGSIGTPVKVEKDGKIWTFRFSVQADKVERSIFTLWGAGRPSLYEEGVTYRFNLGQFRKPKKD